MSKTLTEIVKEIKFLKNWTVEEVARSIGYSRIHLTKEMRKPSSPQFVKLLQEKHKDILQNVPRETSARVDNSLEFLSHEIIKLTGTLRVVLRAQAEVLAGLRKESVTKTLTELTKAVNDEISAEFSELGRKKDS